MPRVAVLNLARQLAHDEAALSLACKGADVLLVCEAIRRDGIPIALASLLPDGWATMQDISSPSRAGSAVCWRKATMQPAGDSGLVLGSKAGDNVRTRFIAYADLEERATGDVGPYAAWHAPLAKTGSQDEFYLNLWRWAHEHPDAILGGDGNRPHANVAKLLGRQSTGREVIGLHYPADVRLEVAHRLTHLGSDHPIIRATLTTPRKETPVSGLCPFATHKLIPPGANDPAIRPRVAVLHVDAGNAESLYDYFRDRSGGIESHFHIQRDGGLEQYRDIYHQADANHRANDFAVSIETQGYGDGEWTDEQLATIKRLLQWLHDEAGIPLQRCERWDGGGVGYHVQFGAPGPWTPVAKSCPGPKRIAQFDHVLVPWMKSFTTPATATPEELDMDETTLRKIVREEVAAIFRDEDGGLPDIGRARVQSRDGKTVLTLADLLYGILNQIKEK